MSRRTERVSNLVRNAIGQLLLSKISDPRIDPAVTSITRVEVPEDLLTAKVYVSVMGDEPQQRRTVQGLRHAAGHIQELMMQSISLRHTPILEFAPDTGFKKTLATYAIIEEAMAELREKQQSPQDETETD